MLGMLQKCVVIIALAGLLGALSGFIDAVTQSTITFDLAMCVSVCLGVCLFLLTKGDSDARSK